MLVQFNPVSDGLPANGAEVDSEGALVAELVSTGEGRVLVGCHAHLTQHAVIPHCGCGGGRSLHWHTASFKGKEEEVGRKRWEKGE